MQVNILVTVPKPELFDACTLCFDTIRVGFPKATIYADINADLCAPGMADKAFFKACHQNIFTTKLSSPVHHAEWIRRVLMNHKADNGPCIILDADTIFWKSCEDWFFDAPLAGYFVPTMWNDFAQCVSFERLHTSFLWVSDINAVFNHLRSVYPPAHEETGAYCPFDPFMPRVQFVRGQPFFWDSCAGLYNMIGGARFGAKHLECYDHLNSASFYDVMYQRLNNKKSFELIHKTLVKTPALLKGMWPSVAAYYAEKHHEARQFIPLLNFRETPELQVILST